MSVKTLNLKGKLADDKKSVNFYNADIISETLNGKGGADVDITMTFGKIKRTDAQNRWLWGVVYPLVIYEIRNRTGEDVTAAELHTHNLQTIQGAKLEWKKVMGCDVLFIEEARSSKMDTEQFSDMVEKLVAWYAENKQIFIPLPSGDNTLNDFL